MKCPNCSFDNREGAKFCLECGETLDLQCSICDKKLPPAAKFCDECGHRLHEVAKIEEIPPSTDSARKHVTVPRSELILGKVFLQMVEGAQGTNLSTLAKNVGFLIKNVPFASKKAEDHFDKAIETANEIGANGTLGEAKLDLGLLHKAKGRTKKAKDCISESIKIFEQCEAHPYLKQAKEALASLE